MSAPALTEQQLRFVQEYAADPNATQAYRRAFPGTTYLTARVEGCKLLTNPNVQAELKAARAEYARRARVSGVRVLKELAGIAFVDPADAFDPDPNGGPGVLRPLHEIPPAARRAIESVKVKRRLIYANERERVELESAEYKFAPKVPALDKLGKYMGLEPGELTAGGGRAAANGLEKFWWEPVRYAVDVLGVRPTPDQERIARKLLDPPYRVLVESGHNIGKTFLAAWVVNWWFDTRRPGVTISTAPTDRAVRDVLWAEVRLQRQRAAVRWPELGLYFSPKAPVLDDGPDHWAKGYTSSSGEAFQGRHRPNMLFVFDEAEGVETPFWTTTESMFQPDGTSAWLAILNPTTTSSQAYIERNLTGPDGVSPKWQVESISALDHPNVLEGLAARAGGRAAVLPVPGAVTLEQVEGWLADWFEPVEPADRDPDLDIEFPPGSGKWFRPDPDGEARVLGRRPTAGSHAVWAEKLWERATTAALAYAEADRPEVGCDVARFGSDKTEIHVRCGPASLHHEDHGGWDTVRVADRLMELAGHYAHFRNAERAGGSAPWDPRLDIKIKVDDTGVGGGVTDILVRNGYAAVPVNGGETAHEPDKYPNARSELWFQLRDRAKAGRLDLSRLPPKRLGQLKLQALAPVWWPDAARRRVVEPKEKTKDRLGRSPDGLDALNLAYYEPPGWGVASDVAARR